MDSKKVTFTEAQVSRSIADAVLHQEGHGSPYTADAQGDGGFIFTHKLTGQSFVVTVRELA